MMNQVFLSIHQWLKAYPLVITIVALCTSLFACGVGFMRLFAALYPIIRQIKDRNFLNEKLSRGPFSKSIIERSTRYYIRPRCSNMDPSQEEELRRAPVAVTNYLFDRLDDFLYYDDSKRHLLILADSGIGKTSFFLNYFAHNARRPMRKRHKIFLVPLGYKEADDFIEKCTDKEETVLFLDALDEDTKAIADHKERISELMQLAKKFKRVIISCRTQFFLKDEEIPIETGIIRLGPTRAGESRMYEFWKLYLSPFSDDDVKQYIRYRFPIWRPNLRRRANMVAKKIKKLSVRPMLLAHIPEIINQSDFRTSGDLYNIMICAWIKRESTFVEPQPLLKFTKRISVDMYLKRQSRGTESIPYHELTGYANTYNIQLSKWQLTGRSLLNRDAEGNYKFSHRSIMEYLFVKELVHGNHYCNNIALTDQMIIFLVEEMTHTSADTELITTELLRFPNLDAYNINTQYPSGGTDKRKSEFFIKAVNHINNMIEQSKDKELIGALREQTLVIIVLELIRHFEPAVKVRGDETEAQKSKLKPLRSKLSDIVDFICKTHPTNQNGIPQSISKSQRQLYRIIYRITRLILEHYNTNKDSGEITSLIQPMWVIMERTINQPLHEYQYLPHHSYYTTALKSINTNIYNKMKANIKEAIKSIYADIQQFPVYDDIARRANYTIMTQTPNLQILVIPSTTSYKNHTILFNGHATSPSTPFIKGL